MKARADPGKGARWSLVAGWQGEFIVRALKFVAAGSRWWIEATVS